MKPASIEEYHDAQTGSDRAICVALRCAIETGLPDADGRLWHAHPVWFLNGNQIVGYSKIKASVRLMFWSGADFGEPALIPGTGKFRDASAFYTRADEIDPELMQIWLTKARTIQWDYRNIVKRKGRLERLR